MKTIDEAAKDYVDKTIDANATEMQECALIDFKAGAEFVQRWIPVKEEEEPKPREFCLVKFSDGTTMYAQFNAFGKWIIYWYGGASGEDKHRPVTHWRPIEYK